MAGSKGISGLSHPHSLLSSHQSEGSHIGRPRDALCRSKAEIGPRVVGGPPLRVHSPPLHSLSSARSFSCSSALPNVKRVKGRNKYQHLPFVGWFWNTPISPNKNTRLILTIKHLQQKKGPGSFKTSRDLSGDRRVSVFPCLFSCSLRKTSGTHQMSGTRLSTGVCFHECRHSLHGPV